jgi:hypothetical protein
VHYQIHTCTCSSTHRTPSQQCRVYIFSQKPMNPITGQDDLQMTSRLYVWTHLALPSLGLWSHAYILLIFSVGPLSHVIAPGEVCRVCTVSTIVAAKLCKRFTNSARFLVEPLSHTAPDEVSRVGTI